MYNVLDDIYVRHFTNFETLSFSVLCLLVDTGVAEIVYFCVYRSGDQKSIELFKHLSETSDWAQCRYGVQLVILGNLTGHHQK